MSSANTNDLSIRFEQHVATIEMRRPPHNFIDNELLHGIADTFEAYDKNPDCRAIMLCAEGKNFCAGANYKPASLQSPDDDVVALDLDAFFVDVVRIYSVQTPIVAAVQGAAIGGGLGLAVSADFRVTCPEGRFSANFARLGFTPGFGLALTLPRLIGKQRAALMFLTGRRIKGELAFDWGLADACVPLADVANTALALAREIASCAPLAVASTRKTLRHDLAAQVAEQNVHDLAEQHRLRATHDWQEGITAVAERREPHFTGS